MKTITTIFKQTDKGLIGFYPSVKKGEKTKVIFPDKHSHAAMQMIPGEWEVIIKDQKEKFDTCIPIKQLFAKEEDIMKLATLHPSKKEKIKKTFQFASKNELKKLSK